MIPEQLLLVCEERAFEAAHALATDVLSHWPNEEPPHLRLLQPGDLPTLEGEFARFEAVWVYAEFLDENLLDATLDALDGWHTPTLLTRHNETEALGAAFSDGIVLGAADSPSESLCLILQSLVCQGRLTNAMKAEMNLVRRHQRGLVG
ncbi:MAG: hypothetical protein ACYTGQ_08610, partial [Planctomycetota bacterium]